MSMLISNIRAIVFVTILIEYRSVSCGSVRLLGPKCGDDSDDSKGRINCGSSVQTNVEGGTIKLGNLCEDEQKLRFRIIRENIDIEGNYSKLAHDFEVNYIQKPYPPVN